MRRRSVWCLSAYIWYDLLDANISLDQWWPVSNSIDQRECSLFIVYQNISKLVQFKHFNFLIQPCFPKATWYQLANTTGFSRPTGEGMSLQKIINANPWLLGLQFHLTNLKILFAIGNFCYENVLKSILPDLIDGRSTLLRYQAITWTNVDQGPWHNKSRCLNMLFANNKDNFPLILLMPGNLISFCMIYVCRIVDKYTWSWHGSRFTWAKYDQYLCGHKASPSHNEWPMSMPRYV